MRVELEPWTTAWADRFTEHAARIRAALGDVAVEHVGSTSVLGMIAKPYVDVLLLVADPTREESYVPALERAGYEFRFREPAFHEHRLLRWDVPRANVHVFAVGSEEAARMVAFRDRLNADPYDRAAYGATKQALAAREWESLEAYTQAKTEVIEAILLRASLRGR